MRRFFVFLVFPFFVVSAFAVDNPYSISPDIGPGSLRPVVPGDPGYMAPSYNWYDSAAGEWYDLPAVSGQPVLQLPDNALITTYQQDDIQVFSTVDPVTPADATGLKKILLELIGNYESIVTDYRYQNSNGTWSYLREIQPDYVWLASAAVFAIVLWCTFRAGVSICKR